MNPNGLNGQNYNPQGFGPMPNNPGPNPQMQPQGMAGLGGMNAMQPQMQAPNTMQPQGQIAAMPNPAQAATPKNVQHTPQSFQELRDNQAQEMLDQIIQSTDMPEEKEEKEEEHHASKGLIITVVILSILVVGQIVGTIIFALKNKNLNTQLAETNQQLEVKTKESDGVTTSIRVVDDMPTFSGPAEYNMLSFNYPKGYIIKIDNPVFANEVYTSYFYSPDYPDEYAFSFKIINEDYETYIKHYNANALVKSNAISTNNIKGTATFGKLDGDKEQEGGAELAIQLNGGTGIIRTNNYKVFAGDIDTILKNLKTEK